MKWDLQKWPGKEFQLLGVGHRGLSSGAYSPQGWVGGWPVGLTLSQEAGSRAHSKRAPQGLRVCMERREDLGWEGSQEAQWAGFRRTGRMDVKRWENILGGRVD